MTLYLDYNATTPVHPTVLDTMVEVYRTDFGNAGSRTHGFGQRAKLVVEKARNQVAALAGVQSNEVVFTSGATEANNLALLGLARWGADNSRYHIISTQIEHKAVLEPLEHLQCHGINGRQFDVEFVQPKTTGRVDTEDILSRVRLGETLLVSVQHANNETGVIQPVQELGIELAKLGVFFHIDAAQTFGKLVDELRQISYTSLAVSGHKIFGPQGIGALLVKRKQGQLPPIRPLMFGGGQERGIRPGTLPVALIAGLGMAAELAERHHPEWQSHLLELKSSIMDQLGTVNTQFNGDQRYALSSCVNVSFPGIDAEGLMLALGDEIAVSNGSACYSERYEPSYVLRAMGLDDDIVESAIRMSWGPRDHRIDLTPLVKFVQDNTL